MYIIDTKKDDKMKNKDFKLDEVYPIGSIYFQRVESKEKPSKLFGGTWKRLKGYMPFGAFLTIVWERIA